MFSSQAPRPRHTQAYEELKELSPWDVRIDAAAVAQVLSLLSLHPHLEGFFTERLMAALRGFPPDPKYFSDPEMSWSSPLVWVTVTERHVRLRVKAEYRKAEGTCWIVDLRPATGGA